MNILILMILKIASCNFNCNSDGCKTCLSGLNYKSISCLDKCPYGFLSNGTSCLDQGDPVLFTLEFVLFLKLNSKNIESFSHPEYLIIGDSSKKLQRQH